MKDKQYISCSYCKHKSSLIDVFHMKAKRGEKRWVCPGCYQFIINRCYYRLGMVGGALLPLVAFYLLYDSSAAFVWLYINIYCLLMLFYPLAVLANETGHFIAAKLTGAFVAKVVIGGGPKLFSFRVGETFWEFRRYWFYGTRHLGLEPEQTNKKLKYGLIYLAGPGANLLLALAACPFSEPFALEHFADGFYLAWMFILSQVIVFVLSLLPTDIPVITSSHSDRKQLLKIACGQKNHMTDLRYPLAVLQSYLEQKDYQKGYELCEALLETMPSNLYINLYYSYFLILDNQYAEAIRFIHQSQFKRELLAENEYESLMATLNNNLAYAYFKLGDDHNIKAGHYAEQAFEVLPWVPAVINTYAWLLVTKKEYDKALVEVLRAMQLEQADQELFQNFLLCAKIYLLKRDKENFYRYIFKAARLGGHTYELDRLMVDAVSAGIEL